MSGVPQGFVLGPMLFSNFFNDISSWIECTVSKFTDDSKLSGAVDTLVGRESAKEAGWLHCKELGFA